ncbi:MAG: hypothetical protein HQK55_15525 [Deltaproteobacteria bacterium]|nr:hypothetical protein [Deltaproteobacteria bacterium]
MDTLEWNGLAEIIKACPGHRNTKCRGYTHDALDHRDQLGNKNISP